MRDLFSVVAVLLIAVLCAALAVPYFVDWESRRVQVEAALGRAFGVEVRTGGAITVRLLPTPRLELERLSVGGAEPFLTAAGLDVALEAPPLISGRIEVTSARLLRPELRLVVNENGALRLPAPVARTLSDLESVGIARLDVDQGTIRVTGMADGAPSAHVIGPFNATASAPSIAGPWRIDASRGDVAIHLATGAPGADGRMRLKLRAGDAATGTQADFEGYLQPDAQQAVTGRLALSQPLPRPSGAAAAPGGDEPRIGATAEVTGEGWQFALAGVEVRSGDGAGALALSGAGAVDAAPLLEGGMPRVTLALDSRRLDIAPFVAAWMRDSDFVSGSVARLFGGVPVDLALNAGSLAFGSEALGAASLELKTDPPVAGDYVALPRFDLALPGGGGLSVVDGGLGAGPELSGAVTFRAGDVMRLAGALREAAVNGSTEEELGLLLRLAQILPDWPGLALSGHVEMSPAGVAVRGLDASAGESTASGDLLYTRAPEDGRPRIDARLVLQGVDLGALPNLDPMVAVNSGVDIEVELEARRLRLGAAPPEEGRRMTARFSTAADGVTIERFDLTDPDGAHLSASGHLGDDGGRISAIMEADDPGGLFALYRPFLPTNLDNAVEQAIPALGPLRLEVTAARPGAGSPLVATVKGRAARTDVDGRIVSDPRGAAGDRAIVDLQLTSPDAAGLLRQLGLADREGDAPAGTPGKLALAARGNSFARLDGRADLTAGADRLVLDGIWRDGADGVSLSGPLQLDTKDIGALAALLGHPLPATAEPVAATLTGALEWRPGALSVAKLHGALAGNAVTGELSAGADGLRGEIGVERLALGELLALALGPGARPQAGQIWSSRRLGEQALILVGDLVLKVKQLVVTPALVLENASLRVGMAPETVTLAIAETGVGGGRAKGDIVLRRLGAQVGLTGRIALEQVALAALTRQPVAGEVGGKLEFGASAESVAGLVGNLAGGGEARITGAAIPDFDADALRRTLASLIGDAGVEMDPARVAASLGAALDEGAWPVPELDVPLTMASGAIRFGPLALEAGGTRAGVSGSFDLGSLMLDARAHLAGAALPDGWSGAAPQAIVTWRGPLDALRRDVEAGSVANGLAAIGLVRELDRIERLEAEARERMEKARRDREERARLEAEKRAQEERARQEQQEQERRERQEQERLRQEEAERARLEALSREAAQNPPPPVVPEPAAPVPLDITPDVRSP